ncbi:TPA: hypothetical protein ACXJSN_003203 [Pseudomonas aeruginosa]
MYTAPIDHPLNLTTQLVLTSASYALFTVALLVAIGMGLRQRTPFYVLVMLAAAFGAIFEPLYDEGQMLYFYSIGQWTLYSAFETPQPVWTISGYAILYGANAIFICDRMHRGTMDSVTLYTWALITFLGSCVFEMYGINGGAYEYYGPHAFRVLEYPLVIGVLETAQVICFSFVAAELRRRTRGHLPLLMLFVLFPCMFYFANFGAGAPTIIALHLDTPNKTAVQLATLLSIGFALLLIHGVARALPKTASSSARAMAMT